MPYRKLPPQFLGVIMYMANPKSPLPLEVPFKIEATGEPDPKAALNFRQYFYRRRTLLKEQYLLPKQAADEMDEWDREKLAKIPSWFKKAIENMELIEVSYGEDAATLLFDIKNRPKKKSSVIARNSVFRALGEQGFELGDLDIDLE